eukprot:XP_006513020.1 PREDICTED: translation initiation factor IF-2-like [Mus musculus]
MGIPCALRWGGGLRRKLHIQQAEQSDCRSSQDAPGLGGPTGIPTPQAGFGFGEPSKQERSAASASARRRGRLRALGKTQRHSRGGGGGGRAGGRYNGRGRARHSPGCASSASLRAPVRAALAKGVPVLPAPDPPPPAADSERRLAANEAAVPRRGPQPTAPRAPHRSGPEPTSRPPPQPPRSLFSSASEPAADGDARGRHVTARRSRGGAAPAEATPPHRDPARGGPGWRSPRWLLLFSVPCCDRAAPCPCSGPPSPSAWRILWPPGSELVEVHLGGLWEEARPSVPGRRAFPKLSLGSSPMFPLAVPLERLPLVPYTKKAQEKSRRGLDGPRDAPIYSPHKWPDM